MRAAPPTATFLDGFGLQQWRTERCALCQVSLFHALWNRHGLLELLCTHLVETRATSPQDVRRNSDTQSVPCSCPLLAHFSDTQCVTKCVSRLAVCLAKPLLCGYMSKKYYIRATYSVDCSCNTLVPVTGQLEVCEAGLAAATVLTHRHLEEPELVAKNVFYRVEHASWLFPGESRDPASLGRPAVPHKPKDMVQYCLGTSRDEQALVRSRA